MQVDGVVLRVVHVTRIQGEHPIATLSVSIATYEGRLLEQQKPACGRAVHPLQAGDFVVLRLGERPSGDLFFKNVSCACTYLLHGVSSWPTGMPRPLPRLPDAEPWHSTLGTDRAVYHDDTRCPEGDSIKVEYRRWGTGGRAACEHCRAA